MLSEKYRPKCWDDFVGQPIVHVITKACHDPWLGKKCGERWLFESDGVAGCGKTEAAKRAFREMFGAKAYIELLDSRQLEQVEQLYHMKSIYGAVGTGYNLFLLDEIQQLKPRLKQALLGVLQTLPTRAFVIATTTSLDWEDGVLGLLSRFRRFRFQEPNHGAVARHLRWIAKREKLPIPAGFKFLSYVKGEYGYRESPINVRALIDQMPDVLRLMSCQI